MKAAPLEYLAHAAGPASVPTQRLEWVLIALVGSVVAIVAALLVAALTRRRAKSGEIGAEAGGMGWIYVGTGLSSVALFAVLVYVMATLESVAAPPAAPVLTIDVTAYDWWWKVEYSDVDNPSHAFATANEIHIPVGEPVRLALHSADVIHTFWVPQLAGKTEMIPGQTNEQWVQADRPGIYRGQCSQFCGAQHAHMAFEVIAEPAPQFDAWRRSQMRGAAVPPEGAARAGQRIFGERCAGCHAVRGTDAAGAQGPDLTHLGARRLLAAGQLQNTPENQLEWIEHAQRIKPDSMMPSIALPASEASALSAYLSTLQ
ncbi:cytochrome c oxidase subunit II [Trinickia caryophylli]|uniref:Cytochrome aa3 subunit 2 n=1 Tax=Trinickia caryophylli TaxID=28094 RepID=A0A1X7EC15_TRICW|nr:cytochrome c oxidase subunit II [Trinickia caryophylli]PMS12926.1 cytochrome c oxidase subunit II [Trinickia caryophylli]TRX14686.1 cytochrome c oxidase subunit II [Trinickia caryophylli]WQE14529.1 cytochrome c oxidase subunit II [Trinickia caryophylli]SMF31312.1 cytochrome c oxidase subunit 2 [Trinickia caryophylli]GLU32064.1 cytochrome c oxidase polypeptide II [Trinickia caryophylli]